MSNANEPAYPQTSTSPAFDRDCGKYYSDTHSTGGLTKREHAAILLRVPKSGDDEIDAMIREANRRDAAGVTMRGLLSRNTSGPWQKYAECSAAAADALLAELERAA